MSGSHSADPGPLTTVFLVLLDGPKGARPYDWRNSEASALALIAQLKRAGHPARLSVRNVRPAIEHV